jgi:hypothetical protein
MTVHADILERFLDRRQRAHLLEAAFLARALLSPEAVFRADKLRFSAGAQSVLDIVREYHPHAALDLVASVGAFALGSHAQTRAARELATTIVALTVGELAMLGSADAIMGQLAAKGLRASAGRRQSGAPSKVVTASRSTRTGVAS